MARKPWTLPGYDPVLGPQPSAQYVRQLAGATASPAEVKSRAEFSAIASMGQAAQLQQQRAQQLADNIRKGSLSISALGPADAALLGISSASEATRNVGKGPLGLLKNFGSDVKDFTTGLPAGLYTLGKLGVENLNVFKGGALRPFIDSTSTGRKDVFEPTKEYFKNQYLPGGGSYFENLYQHPLAPLLDIATVASGGAGAAARGGSFAVARGASTEGLLGRAARITSTEGRTPLVRTETGQEFPREYSTRPLRKLSQIATDKLAGTHRNSIVDAEGEAAQQPGSLIDKLIGRQGPNPLGNFQLRMEARRAARADDNLRRNTEIAAERAELGDLEKIIAGSKMSPDEVHAWFLSQSGVRTPAGIQSFERMVRGNYENDPEFLQRFQNRTGVDPLFIIQQTKLTPEVKGFIESPTPAMVDAHQAWSQVVNRMQERLGMSMEDTRARLRTETDHLTPHLDDEDSQPFHEVASPEEELQRLTKNPRFDTEVAHGLVPGPDYPIEHIYVPKVEPRNLKWYEPGPIAKLRGVEPGWRRYFPKEPFIPVDRDMAKELFNARKPPSQFSSSGMHFSTGNFRRDMGVLVDQISKSVRYDVQNALNEKIIGRIAAHDDHDKLRYFRNQDEIDSVFGKGKMKFVHAGAPRVWAQHERNLLEELQGKLNGYAKLKGVDPYELLDHPEFESIVNDMLEADAKAFTQAQKQLIDRPGIAIPADEFKYRGALEGVTDAFKTKIGRFFARAMYHWRTLTLTYMPRWWLNTAVGSGLMALVSGALNPNVIGTNIRVAQRLKRAGTLPEELRTLDQPFALPTGVDLGHSSMRQLYEEASLGNAKRGMAKFADEIGAKGYTAQISKGVQGTENFFRRVIFVHNLRREARLAKAGEGRQIDLGAEAEDATQNLEGINQGIRDFYSDLIGKFGGDIDRAMMNPDFVRRAIDNTDRLMYNYTHLGPFERRVIRSFVPFYGWYKFISKTYYRMLLEDPGRMNVLGQIARIGQDQISDYGTLPGWLKANLVPFGLDDSGALKYLGAMGLNPFGQVFNPLAPEGPLLGTLQFGQFSPFIQAVATAYGLDPLTGSPVRFSPESGVTKDPLGNPINAETGEPVNPSGIDPISRIAGTLYRSVPQLRMLEQLTIGPQYPEGTFFNPKPTGQPSQLGGSTIQALGAQFGIQKRTFDIDKYQRTVAKNQRYARRRHRRELLRIEQNR